MLQPYPVNSYVVTRDIQTLYIYRYKIAQLNMLTDNLNETIDFWEIYQLIIFINNFDEHSNLIVYRQIISFIKISIFNDNLYLTYSYLSVTLKLSKLLFTEYSA